MPQSKERHTEWMRERRVHKEGSQDKGARGQGAQNWETMPLKDIKSALPGDMVSSIAMIGARYCRTEERLRGAYKYQVWHNENFINGICGDLR